MIVHSPTMVRHAGQVTISSRFELRSPLPFLPADLWYRFPEQYVLSPTPRSDGFAAAGLMVAMFAGEDLTIRGPISPRLAYGLYEFRNIFHIWSPRLFNRVDIRFDQLEAAPPPTGSGGVVAAFSGGVDSFFTLWSHLPENQPIPQARLTHGLFMQGFDLRLDNEAAASALAQRYSDMFQKLGLDLIVASTNAYQFAEFRIDWTFLAGPPLLGAAMLLSPFIRRFYVPSSYTCLEVIPQGTTPLTDPMLSTENLDIVHHGISFDRFDKLAVLTRWPVTYSELKVCSRREQTASQPNCSACFKCYRTMVSLSILDSLKKYTSFAPKLAFGDYLRWGLETHMDLKFARDIRRRAFKAGKIGTALRIGMAMTIHTGVRFVIATAKRFLSKERLYRIKRSYFRPESGEAPIKE